MSTTTDPISEAIIAHWGERCDDTMEGCPICADLASTCAKNAQVAPAPVVPAEGLAAAMDRLQTEICCADGDRADAVRDHSDGSERVDLWPHTAEFDVNDVRMVLAALRSAPPVGARVSIPSGLIDALRSQRQIDADGCEVAVSRQACDEAAAILAALLPAGEGE